MTGFGIETAEPRRAPLINAQLANAQLVHAQVPIADMARID